tara:strand:- start:545 stop:973 length:429 start_codon:yes stop_codon:yes gene_type:complete
MFFKNEDTFKEKDYLVNIAALLIHAAKIDENYSPAEENIIKKTLTELGIKNNLDELMDKAKLIEKNSNQILDFTRDVKKLSEEKKIKIIKALWKIIYSNDKADMYETNLMRRLAGLLYIDSKLMGDIKEKIIKENLNDLSSK